MITDDYDNNDIVNELQDFIGKANELLHNFMRSSKMTRELKLLLNHMTEFKRNIYARNDDTDYYDHHSQGSLDNAYEYENISDAYASDSEDHESYGYDKHKSEMHRALTNDRDVAMTSYLLGDTNENIRDSFSNETVNLANVVDGAETNDSNIVKNSENNNKETFDKNKYSFNGESVHKSLFDLNSSEYNLEYNQLSEITSLLLGKATSKKFLSVTVK